VNTDLEIKKQRLCPQIDADSADRQAGGNHEKDELNESEDGVLVHFL
jgi:hypothetical protein